MAINPTPYEVQCNICGYIQEFKAELANNWKCSKCEERKMKMTKYCVAKPEPKWKKVKYRTGDFLNFQVEAHSGHFKFSVQNGGETAAIAVSMEQMQDLIDSLQAFYNQEKEDNGE